MYQEDIRDIIEQTGEKITTLVIPKNSGLKGYAWKVLKEAGLKLDDAEEIAKNRLHLDDLTLVLKRGEDIPQFVVDYANKGEVVLGVTGDDLFDEFRLKNPDNPLKLENTYDWFDDRVDENGRRYAKFYRPALCFINRTGNLEDVPLEAKIALNNKYVETSRLYLRQSPATGDRKFRETLYSGDVEITVAEGVNDCCIDTVYSGKTLTDNGLQIIGLPIRFSDLAVISALKSEESLFGKAMAREYAQVLERVLTPTDSYTSKVLTNPEKLVRKGVEEMLELALAAIGVGDGKPVAEAADAIYALNMLIAKTGLTLDEIAREMIKRQK